MLRSDEIVLIAEAFGQGDANGFRPTPVETRRTVYGDARSVSAGEFYAANAASMTAALKFVMYADEYGGETLAEHLGKRLRITRTYVDGDDIELTLAELPERTQNGADQV